MKASNLIISVNCLVPLDGCFLGSDMFHWCLFYLCQKNCKWWKSSLTSTYSSCIWQFLCMFFVSDIKLFSRFLTVSDFLILLSIMSPLFLYCNGYYACSISFLGDHLSNLSSTGLSDENGLKVWRNEVNTKPNIWFIFQHNSTSTFRPMIE